MPVTDTKLSSLTRATLLCAALTAAFLLFIAPSPASAEEEPFKIEFDRSNIQIGLLGALPLDSIATGASLEGTIDEAGNVTIPQGQFKMPELGLDQPIRIRGFMGIESPATGTYDRATGQLDMDAKAGIWLSVDVAAVLDLVGFDIGDLLGGGGGGGLDIGNLIKPLLSDLTCGFSPMNVHFTTESNSLTSGARFADGPTGTGAITAEWSQLGPFAGRTKILGLVDPCQLILQYLPDLLEGGLGGSLPGGIDLGGLDLAGLLAGLNNLNLGPSAIKLIRSQADQPIDPDPVDPPKGSARLKLTVTPKHRRVKAGKSTVFKVKVRNTGTARATNVRVCLTGPRAGILVKWRCPRFGAIKAGTGKVRRITVKVRRKAPQRTAGFRFTVKSANAVKRTAGARLRVRG